MNKTHILFSVAGMSPAIITETLFGLYQKDIKSGEVHLLTTVQGHQSMQVLFKQIPLFNEMYHTLWHIQSDWIEILQNGQQQALHDLRTFSDNEHAANTIIERIRDWTQQDNIILHASIAGGRKTMGIYVAQAMSWFARPKDNLSHVLVSEAFERDRHFYFPDKNNPKHRHIIDFAELPFVRMRNLWPPLLQKKERYSECVTLSEIYLKDISKQTEQFTLDLHKRTICIETYQLLKLQPLSIALFLFLLKHANTFNHQEPFYFKDAFQYRDKLIECLQKVDLRTQADLKNRGLSCLVSSREENWPVYWTIEGTYEYIELRKDDLNNAFGKLNKDLKQTWANGSLQIFQGKDKGIKVACRWVDISLDRVKVIGV